MLHRTTCATTGGTYLTRRAAFIFITLEAGALGRTARVVRATYLAARAADALPGAELLGLTADAVFRRAHLAAPASAMDFAATAISYNVIAFSFAELTTGFWMALMVVLNSVPVIPVMIVVTAPAASADDGPIATTTGVKRDRRVGIGDDEAQ